MFHLLGELTSDDSAILLYKLPLWQQYMLVAVSIVQFSLSVLAFAGHSV
jgi:hypothetical protein